MLREVRIGMQMRWLHWAHRWPLKEVVPESKSASEGNLLLKYYRKGSKKNKGVKRTREFLLRNPY